MKKAGKRPGCLLQALQLHLCVRSLHWKPFLTPAPTTWGTQARRVSPWMPAGATAGTLPTFQRKRGTSELVLRQTWKPACTADASSPPPGKGELKPKQSAWMPAILMDLKPSVRYDPPPVTSHFTANTVVKLLERNRRKSFLTPFYWSRSKR